MLSYKVRISPCIPIIIKTLIQYISTQGILTAGDINFQSLSKSDKKLYVEMAMHLHDGSGQKSIKSDIEPLSPPTPNVAMTQSLSTIDQEHIIWHWQVTL